MNVVLDASAVIAFLRGEPGSEVVYSHATRRTDTLLMHAINLCEVYYDFLRASGETSAEGAVSDMFRLGVHERADFPERVWRPAAGVDACPTKCKMLLEQVMAEEKRRQSKS